MSLQVSYPEPPFSEKFRVNKKTAHAIRVSGLFLFTLPVILRSVNRIVTLAAISEVLRTPGKGAWIEGGFLLER